MKFKKDDIIFHKRFGTGCIMYVYDRAPEYLVNFFDGNIKCDHNEVVLSGTPEPKLKFKVGDRVNSKYGDGTIERIIPGYPPVLVIFDDPHLECMWFEEINLVKSDVAKELKERAQKQYDAMNEEQKQRAKELSDNDSITFKSVNGEITIKSDPNLKNGEFRLEMPNRPIVELDEPSKNGNKKSGIIMTDWRNLIPAGVELLKYIPGTPRNKSTLPIDSQDRKNYALFRGCIRYFPAALAGVAKTSTNGNDKHNPGEEMYHARSKSQDHGDCVIRHLIDLEDLLAARERGDTTITDEQILTEANQFAWRALALSQKLHESMGSPMAPGAKE